MSKEAKRLSLSHEQLALQEAYANIYNEITRPKQVFVDSQYFRKRWVPLLGHSLAWLIIALRQHCYWNRETGELRDWCLVSQEEVAAEVGIDTRTMRRLLKRQYADKFVLEVDMRYRYDQKLGKQVRNKTFYRIRMDDPLTPEDEDLLRQRLAEETAGSNIDPETGQIDMLKLLDRPLHQLPDLADKMTARSNPPPNTSTSTLADLPDKESVRSDLADKMSGNIPDQADKMSARSSHQADKMSAILYTGQNVRNHDNTYIIQDSPGEIQQQQYLPAGVAVHQKDLKNLTLADDQVLTIISDDTGSFHIESLAKIVKCDIHAAGQYDPWRLNTSRCEVYYSIEHALGEGSDEWSGEEMRKIRLREKLEQELGHRFNRLGAFSLEEALRTYFDPQLVAQLLRSKSEADLAHMEDWVVYTRRAKNLRNPAGFLRSKLESGEAPPAVKNEPP